MMRPFEYRRASAETWRGTTFDVYASSNFNLQLKMTRMSETSQPQIRAKHDFAVPENEQAATCSLECCRRSSLTLEELGREC